MATDPSLITQMMANWRAPAPIQVADPLAQFQKLQALKSGIQAQAIQNLQLKAAQDAEDQRQRDLNDDKIMQQAAQDPATMQAVTSWDGKSPFPLAGKGLQFKTLQAVQAKILADQKAAADWSEQQRKTNLDKLERVGKVLPGLMYDEKGQPRSDADIAAAAPALVSQLQQEGVLPKDAPPPVINSFADAQKYAMQHGYVEGIAKYAQAGQEAAAKPGLTKAQTDEAQAKAEADRQTARKTKMMADAMEAATKNPQQGAALIDAAIPLSVDKQANNGYKAAWQAAMNVGNLDGAAQIVAAAAAHAAALSPANTVQKVNEAVAVKKATAPIEVANEIAKQKALNAMSPEMFAGIYNPSARLKAQDQYQKYTGDYLDQAQNAQQLKDFIAAAQSGNKAAPGLIPMSEVRTIVNRVNRQELEAQSGAGSLYDKAKGWLSGATEGQPIPKDILDGINKIADIELRNSRSKYDNKVKSLNATYGSNVPGVTPPESIAAPPAVPDHVKQAAAAPVGALITLPDGTHVKKLGPNQFLKVDARGFPIQ